MSYERDTDAHLKGVGTIAASAGARPRASIRRRVRQAQASRSRDRAMAGMTYGPNGGLQGLGMIKIPSFGRIGSNMAPVVTAGGYVEGGGTIGGGGAINTGGGMTGSSGGGGVGGSLPPPGSGGKTKVTNLGLSTVNLGPMLPPPYVGICVDAKGNHIPCPSPASGGPVWNPSSGIVPPTLPPTTTVTTDPVTGTTTVTTSGGGSGGGGGGGINTDPVPLPPIDVPPATDLSPVPTDGMTTNTKIALGVGAVALAYFLFKKKGA